MAKVRTFIAIELDDRFRRYLGQLAGELRKRVEKGAVRWVPANNIHLTLSFLGDTEVEKLPEIFAGLDSVSGRSRPFTLTMDKLGCFPKPRRPRVIWAGLDSSNDGLSILKSDLEEMLCPLGWEREIRRFHPHLTLGRVKESRSVLKAQFPWGLQLDSLNMHVSEICLIESFLKPTGAEYHVRHRSNLGGQGL